MKSRECIYCKRFFDCKERGEGDYCLLFTPRDEEAQKAYKEWRAEENANK